MMLFFVCLSVCFGVCISLTGGKCADIGYSNAESMSRPNQTMLYSLETERKKKKKKGMHVYRKKSSPFVDNKV